MKKESVLNILYYLKWFQDTVSEIIATTHLRSGKYDSNVSSQKQCPGFLIYIILVADISKT